VHFTQCDYAFEQSLGLVTVDTLVVLTLSTWCSALQRAAVRVAGRCSVKIETLSMLPCAALLVNLLAALVGHLCAAAVL